MHVTYSEGALEDEMALLLLLLERMEQRLGYLLKGKTP